VQIDELAQIVWTLLLWVMVPDAVATAARIPLDAPMPPEAYTPTVLKADADGRVISSHRVSFTEKAVVPLSPLSVTDPRGR